MTAAAQVFVVVRCDDDLWQPVSAYASNERAEVEAARLERAEPAPEGAKLSAVLYLVEEVDFYD